MIRRLLHTSLVLLTLEYKGTFAGPVEDFEDILFWTGAGDNRAALVIDWDYSSSADAALVWGFRWNGSATGEDMLKAIVAADERLFAKFGTKGSFGLPVYGLGYDQNDNGGFQISDGSVFDEQGITIGSIPDPPPQTNVATALDSGDLYAEGFFTGSFNYAVSVGNPFAEGHWQSSVAGVSSRTLSDGSWDGWTYESPAALISTAYPANPIAATGPTSADFNGDGHVDARDFLAWQRGHGLTLGAQPGDGDANSDGRVNQLDLRFWQASYGNWPGSATSLVIPEPSTLVILMFASFSITTLHQPLRRNV